MPKKKVDYSQGEEAGGDSALCVAEQLKPYDLEERTAQFGENIIDFLKKVPVNSITQRLIDQLSGAGTSVGANYCEADDAPSKKAFKNSISTCKREAREAKFFLRMIARAAPELKNEARPLWQEAKELHLIFAKIYRG
ncbi:MAG: four helix bundle protein [Lentisphaeria bacterium]|nr:four helix bundle protein [Lentisphaeria bacterium]